VDIFFQQILNGLVLGSIYALIALGYTMVYGIMGLINFAHGEVVMIGAMVCITVVSTLMHSGVDLPGWAIVLIGTLVAIPACALLGFVIERVAYRPLRGAQRLAPLITAIGLSISLQQVAILIWGRNYIPSLTF
jgi:branched-chain amino acid transport system permease protein